ncbi:hypothetical protein J6590_014171 [Homalodisca vitripennis]|nr:hypothetical protein J6590_014171 [Homalodisca vitripennis]
MIKGELVLDRKLGQCEQLDESSDGRVECQTQLAGGLILQANMKWTEEETLKFVELYRDAECLWNLASPTYKNKQMRQAAIDNLVKDMGKEGFGIQEAKQKIKNMRSTYNQELTKIKISTKSGAGSTDIYVPAVKWFAILDPVMKIGRGQSEATSNLESNTMDDEVESQGIFEDELSDTSGVPACEQETPRRVSTPTVHTQTGAKLTGRKRRIEELSHAVNKNND